AVAPTRASADEPGLARIAAAGAAGKTLPAVAAELGQSTEEAERTAASLASAGRLVRSGALLFEAATWRALKERTGAELSSFHAREPLRPGMAREALRTAVARAMPAEAFRQLLHEMAQDHAVTLAADRV